jgi:hypothetical protein
MLSVLGKFWIYAIAVEFIAILLLWHGECYMRFILLIVISLITLAFVDLAIYDSFAVTSPADFDLDGDVDGEDLQQFALQFGNIYLVSADFAWDANTESNLAGYKIYYGLASRDYNKSVDIPDKTATTGTVTHLEIGVTYYFAAVAYDTDGFESDYSNEVVWTAKGAIE